MREAMLKVLRAAIPVLVFAAAAAAMVWFVVQTR